MGETVAQTQLSFDSAKEWVNDYDAPTCQSCYKSFSMKFRRHHCRACGKVVCDPCSQERHSVVGESGPSRVCDECVSVKRFLMTNPFDSPEALVLTSYIASQNPFGENKCDSVSSAVRESSAPSGANPFISLGGKTSSNGGGVLMQTHTMSKQQVEEVARSQAAAEELHSVYTKKIRPVEAAANMEYFQGSMLCSGEFKAPPIVLLLGQYSTGKTTFCRHLLGRDFPGANIGPEPTTDRFTALVYGEEERIVPGHAMAVQEDLPFKGLGRFGSGFLNSFQGSQCAAPLLEKFILIDSPGILSGNKQRLGRAYDYQAVTGWFAEKADIILIMFDTHKLDISDEYKDVLEEVVARGCGDKLRVILNKADALGEQQLMRVYGALMWSLGKVFCTPEVMRVYMGNYSDRPLQFSINESLFEAEYEELLADLAGAPRQSTLRKLNGIVRRLKLLKVQLRLQGYLREQMPLISTAHRRKKALAKLCSPETLPATFRDVYRKYALPPNDFPNIGTFAGLIEDYDSQKLWKMNEAEIEKLDTVLNDDLPRIMRLLAKPGAVPQELGGGSGDNTSCPICGVEFSVTTWKYACQFCGDKFCYADTRKGADGERSCKVCFFERQAS